MACTTCYNTSPDSGSQLSLGIVMPLYLTSAICLNNTPYTLSSPLDFILAVRVILMGVHNKTYSVDVHYINVHSLLELFSQSKYWLW